MTTVIGCVWGAWRSLQEQWGDAAPPYDWCEHDWHTTLRHRAPAPSYLPDWLRQELWFRWTRGLGDAQQLSLDLGEAP